MGLGNNKISFLRDCLVVKACRIQSHLPEILQDVPVFNMKVKPVSSCGLQTHGLDYFFYRVSSVHIALQLQAIEDKPLILVGSKRLRQLPYLDEIKTTCLLYLVFVMQTIFMSHLPSHFKTGCNRTNNKILSRDRKSAKKSCERAWPTAKAFHTALSIMKHVLLERCVYI